MSIYHRMPADQVLNLLRLEVESTKRSLPASDSACIAQMYKRFYARLHDYHQLQPTRERLEKSYRLDTREKSTDNRIQG